MMRPERKMLSGLRQCLADIEAQGFAGAPQRFGFGLEDVDCALGGLPRPALHEMFAAGTGHAPAALGFALALALRAAGRDAAVIWVRQDMAAQEMGEIYAPGLAEFGADPSRFILVRVRDALQALRAANEALRCPALGAVLIEPWGAPKALDLTASRRLAQASARSGVPAFLIRIGAAPQPSAAYSRWNVRTDASSPLPMDAPGAPVFDIDLVRHRAGHPPRSFRVEWNRDELVFRGPTLSRAVAAFAPDRQAAPDEGFRRTG